MSAGNHEADEAQMRSIPVPVQAMDAAAAAAKPSPSFLEQALSRIGPSPPQLAVENASVASALAGIALAFASIAASIPALAAALILYAMDGSYRMLQREREWFSSSSR
ncbi:MAG: hypothetical protein JTT13_11095 [Candidatus Brockarchaeota archaeon]|nr:hypothetical protein [Candidatus Brockarchaeota archaeon]